MKKLDPKKNYARWYKQDFIYHMHWYFYTGPDVQRCMDNLLHTIKVKFPWDVGQHETAAGTCFGIPGTRAGMIWTPVHMPKLGVVLHECFHLTTFLATKMDAIINESNEEFFSYYQEWLFEEITSVVSKGEKIIELLKKR